MYIFNNVSLRTHLGQKEVYKASPTIWSFKKVADIVNNINLRLSNMAGGFPFEFGGHTWKDSERLYLCGEFSAPTDEHLMVQNALLSATYMCRYLAKNIVATGLVDTAKVELAYMDVTRFGHFGVAERKREEDMTSYIPWEKTDIAPMMRNIQ